MHNVPKKNGCWGNDCCSEIWWVASVTNNTRIIYNSRWSCHQWKTIEYLKSKHGENQEWNIFRWVLRMAWENILKPRTRDLRNEVFEILRDIHSLSKCCFRKFNYGNKGFSHWNHVIVINITKISITNLKCFWNNFILRVHYFIGNCGHYQRLKLDLITRSSLDALYML